VAGTSPRYAPTERLFSKRWGSSTLSTNLSAVRAALPPLPASTQMRFRVALLRDRLQLPLVFADALCERADLLQDRPEGCPERLGDVLGRPLLVEASGRALGQAMAEGLGGPPLTWLTNCVRAPTNASRERIKAI
jgi:hypothetical protein